VEQTLLRAELHFGKIHGTEVQSQNNAEGENNGENYKE